MWAWWSARRITLLRVAVVALSVYALFRLGEGCWRLLSPNSFTGANDLRFRYDEVHRWFAGEPVYTELWNAVYPPASYVMLWPLLGWLSLTAARWLWAATTVLVVVWFTRVIVKESTADSTLERVLVALLFLSMNATGLTIGNGQLTLHLLPALVVSVLLIRRGQRGWRGDVLIGLILVMTMVKPTVSLPFFWLVLLCEGGVRPVVVAGTAYVALTLLSAWFQPIPFATLLAQWIANSQGAARFGYANVSAWCTALGLERLSLPASFSLLIMLGAWTYRYRHADVWILLGVAALVARLWTHHLGYDDVLIVIPLVAAFRLARGERYGGDVVAGALIAITSVVMLTPESVRHARAPWPLLFSLEHTLVWIPLLVLLLSRAPRTAPAAYGVRLTLPSSSRARTAD